MSERVENRIVEQQWWQRRGIQLAGAAAALVTFGANLGNLKSSFFSDGPRLRGSATYGDFVLPPDLLAPIPDSLLLARTSSLSARALDASDTTTAQSVASYYVLTLSERVSRTPGGIWTGTLENSGNRTARDVRVRIERSERLCLYPEDAERICRSGDAPIASLSELPPKARVRFVAWSYSSPFRPSDDAIRLTHAEGVSRLTIRHPVAGYLGSLGYFLGEMPLGWHLLMWGSLLFMAYLLVRSYLAEQSRQRRIAYHQGYRAGTLVSPNPSVDAQRAAEEDGGDDAGGEPKEATPGS